jgi:transposase
MRPLIESLAALEVQIRQATKLLTARAAADPLASRLMTLPGVEPITALTSRAASRIRRGSTGGRMSAPSPGSSPDATGPANVTIKAYFQGR